MKQRTVKRSVSLEGVGIHSGKRVSVSIKPSPAHSGINFIRVDLPAKPLINIQSLRFDRTAGKPRRTTIGIGNDIEVETVEHLMSALHALQIDNVIIEVDGAEIPGLDGSAKPFFDIIREAGIKEYDAEQRVLRLDEPLWVEGEGSFLGIFPSDDLAISYTLSYDVPRPFSEFYHITVNERNFEAQIAPARTFCFEEEARELVKAGLGKGANYENTLVLGKDGPLQNTFRFPDEPVRHKIADLIGDLYLAGCQVKGHAIAIKSGHRLAIEMVRKLKGTLGQ